ncbi:OmpA family protein [Flavobacterium capsici]|uniref:OmpA family protein n=1 Tax=Flavobacterium capsici TaxID=3075618 RepID=A0AA96EYQ8_9FLAO|nr:MULTISPECIES: OmpA family protein [unclassified Flavobacterium]WNM17900.1 OmpA family protein [Flavobacterium sp. PMR2A8]WNM21953.1 OmpA family protein [Flavobacterium sp. PMTSA4]
MKFLKFYLLFFVFQSFSQKQFEVYFDFNKDVPNEKSSYKLNDWIKMNQSAEIISIKGYCDSVDNKFYNKELAEKRIKSTLEILKKNSILINNNLIIEAVGEDFQQSKNQNENRKVVFNYLEKSKPKSINLSENKSIEVVDEIVVNKIETERSSLFKKFEKAKIGDRIAIYNINFKFNSETIEETSGPLLEDLLFIMERNPKLVIKIHGHICCNPNPYNTKLSFRRALKIFKYLRDKGIQQNRLAYNGVGSNNPIYPIPENNEEERIANRRVEIEIVRK